MCPTGGFVYVEPSSGVRFQHIEFGEVLNRVRLHRLANGYALQLGWQKVVEDSMCENYDPVFWHFVDETPGGAPRSIGVADVINFLKVLATWTKDSREFVPQEEAERRAAICSACPKNVPIENCTVCAALGANVAAVLGDRATGRDGELKACQVCGCSNQGQVHFPLSVLQKGITADMVWPSHCWKKPAEYIEPPAPHE